MIAEPAVTPVTLPVLLRTVATAVLPLVQVPPVLTSVKVTEEPAHTVPIPLIPDGSEFTVTTPVILHPVPRV